MKQSLKIFYVTPEVLPFAQTSSIAEVAGSFPKYLKASGHDIRVMMPNYKSINERRYVLRDVIRLQELKIQLGKEIFPGSGKSAFIPDSKVQIYFLDNKDFFGRDGIYQHPKTNKAFEDNARRFLFFAKGCLETLKLLYWQPDIIHCNDWQTALIPMLLNRVYHKDPFFKDCKTLLSIHDATAQGIFDVDVAKEVGLPAARAAEMVRDGQFNFLKIGIEHADQFNLTSASLANDVADGENLSELTELLGENEFVGISNGIDEQVWNPETDRLIPFNYSSDNPEAKNDNKKELLKHLGLGDDADAPVLSTYTHLVNQDGTHEMISLIQQFVDMNVRFISIGNGNTDLSKKLKALKTKNPDKVAYEPTFDAKLSHLLDAGSDFFLVPSKSSAANLSPLYFLAYGTIPIVPQAPAFRDSVTDFISDSDAGNGFVYGSKDAQQILAVVKKALAAYADQEVRQRLLRNAMRMNTSWQPSAQEYLKLYQKLVSARSKRK